MDLSAEELLKALTNYGSGSSSSSSSGGGAASGGFLPAFQKRSFGVAGCPAPLLLSSQSLTSFTTKRYKRVSHATAAVVPLYHHFVVERDVGRRGVIAVAFATVPRNAVRLEQQQQQRDGEEENIVNYNNLDEDDASANNNSDGTNEEKTHLFEAGFIFINPISSSSSSSSSSSPDPTYPRCRASFLFHFKTSVQLSSLKIESHLMSELNVLSSASKFFSKHSFVDDETRKLFLSHYLPSCPPPSAYEAALLSRSYLYTSDDASITAPFKRIRGSLTTFPTVEMYESMKEGEQIAWGKTRGTIHESAELCLAWMWDWCGYERLQQHQVENGDTMRVKFDVPRSRSMIISQVATLPMPFKKRVFDTRFVWGKAEFRSHEAYIIGFEPLALDKPLCKEVDHLPFVHDGKKNTVKGTTVGVYVFEVLAPRLTRMTLIQRGDAGGSLPLWLMNRGLAYSLDVILSVQGRYQRSNIAVDKEVRDLFVSKVSLTSPRPLTPSQHAQMQRTQSLVSDFEASSMKLGRLDSPSKFCDMHGKMGIMREGARHLTTGRSIGVVDATPAEITAFLFDFNSNERLRISHEDGNLARLVFDEPHLVSPENEKICATIYTTPPPFLPREFIWRLIWQYDLSTSRFLVSEESDNVTLPQVDYGQRIICVRGILTGTQIIVEALPAIENPSDPLASIPQSRMTYYVMVDVGGNIPIYAVNAMLPSNLACTLEVQNEFDRSEEVDRAVAAQLVLKMKTEPQKYSAFEDQVIDNMHQFFTTAGLHASCRRIKQFRDSVVEMKQVLVDGDARVVMMASCVMDSDIESAGAWDFVKDTKKKLNIFYSAFGRERKIIHENTHCYKIYSLLSLAPGLSLREFVGICVWKRWSDEKGSPVLPTSEKATSNGRFAEEGARDATKLVCAYETFEDDTQYPVRNTHVRASSRCLMTFDALPPPGLAPFLKPESVSRCNCISEASFRGRL